MNLFESVERTLLGWGEHPALVDLAPSSGAEYFSASALLARIVDTSRLLEASGIRKGFPVLLFLENSVDFICVFLGLVRLGALPVPVKPEYRDIELEEIFPNADPRAVIAEENLFPVLNRFLDGRIAFARTSRGLVLARPEPRSGEGGDFSEETATVNYTYRGYGYPLGALVTHDQYREGARLIYENFHGRPGDRMLVFLPMTHIFSLTGCVFMPLLYGMTAFLSPTIHPRRIQEFIHRHAITSMIAIPEIYRLLAVSLRPDGKKSPLSGLISGGSRMSSEDYSIIDGAFGVSHMHGYGLTEFTPVSANTRGLERPTMGPPCDGVECRIDSTKSADGEIMVRTPYAARGYYRRPRETADVFVDGWLRTGDIGRFDKGHLVFTAEKKGTRKANGVMVDLEEVRKAIVGRGLADGAEVMMGPAGLAARIKPWGGRPPTAADVRQALSGRIAPYKIPKIILVEA
jgi:long-chain acyl-CoA synthetase